MNMNYQKRKVVFREKYYPYEVNTRSRGKIRWKSMLVSHL